MKLRKLSFKVNSPFSANFRTGHKMHIHVLCYILPHNCCLVTYLMWSSILTLETYIFWVKYEKLQTKVRIFGIGRQQCHLQQYFIENPCNISVVSYSIIYHTKLSAIGQDTIFWGKILQNENKNVDFWNQFTVMSFIMVFDYKSIGWTHIVFVLMILLIWCLNVMYFKTFLGQKHWKYKQK